MWKGIQMFSRSFGRTEVWNEIQICHRCLSTYILPFKNLPRQGTPVLQLQGPSVNSRTEKSVFTCGYADFASSKGTHPRANLQEEVESVEENVQGTPKPLQTEAIFKGLETDFPCLSRSKLSGPEPSYDNTQTGFQVYKHAKPFRMTAGQGVLPELDIAYETWGTLNEAKDNAILLFGGLSASSHAKSHADNLKPGWWEKFIGPDCVLNTDRFFVICTNNLGGCNGTTGPSSLNPLTSEPYGTHFPIFSVEDIAVSQFLLLDHLGINNLYAAVGSSLGGMLSLTASVLYPERVRRVVTISACARSHPTSIAMRYVQRKAIMTDPDWQRGHYYNTDRYPKVGMKMAREIATMTYRSGPEWEQRFSREKIDANEDPTLCPTFMIENYLEHQGESFLHKLDPNTQLYISKAMDLFDLGDSYGSLEEALARVKVPVMVIGVQTDILFPVWQQQQVARILKDTGNQFVTHYELNSIYGHDTFLLDLNGVGAGVKGFLETNRVGKPKSP